jgi:tetratricopeptide (TPR) repeat protein
MGSRIVSTLVVVALLALGSAPVAADPSTSESDAEDTAREAAERAARCPGTLAPDEPQDPRKLTSYGVACFEAGDYARAYVLYRKAYEHSESPFLVAALGRSLHEVGLYSLARRHYERFLRQASEDATGAVRKIRTRIEQLDSLSEEASSELKLGSIPDGADAFILLNNGAWVPLGETPLKISVRPQPWTVRIEKEGYIRQQRPLKMRAGATRREQIPMIRVTSEFRRRGRAIKRAGLFTTLASIPLYATAGLFWGLAENDLNRETVASTRFENRGHRRRGAAIGLVSAGTAALAAGLVLWLRGDALARSSEPTPSDTKNSLRIRPRLSPTRAGVEFTW